MIPLSTIFKQVFYLLGVLIVGWILVHFMAVFGFFLAAALPILHLFFYPRIICFWCRRKHSQHTFTHSFIDAGMMLLVTAFSLGIVYGETKLLQRFIQFGDTPNVSFIIPVKNQYRIGEIFSVPISITSIEYPINVVQADLAFDPNLVQVVGIDLSDSFATIIIQKEYNNDLGYIRIAVGTPNPRYLGEAANLGKIYFRAQKSGSTSLKFLDSSIVLANNGKGSNVLKNLGEIPIVILPDKISDDEKLRQEEILISKQVLGDQTSSTQLNFTTYQEDLPKPFAEILGNASPPAPVSAPTTPPSLITRVGSFLHEIDKKILFFWQNILPN